MAGDVTFLEQFSGASGNTVAGWTTFGPVDTFNESSFKYGADNNSAVIADCAQQNQDHGASFDILDSFELGTLELLVKFKFSGPATGTMVGPVANMNWDEFGSYYNFGWTVSIINSLGNETYSLIEWNGYDRNTEDRWETVGTASANQVAGFVAANTWYIARLRLTDTTGKLKVWRPDLGAEPAAWGVEVTHTRSDHGQGFTGVLLDPTSDTSRTQTIDWFAASIDGSTVVNPDASSVNVSIEQPTDMAGFESSRRLVRFSGTWNTTPPASLESAQWSVDGGPEQDATISNGITQYIGTWDAGYVRMNSGDNVFEITLTDNSSLTATDTITVTYTNPGGIYHRVRKFCKSALKKILR
jgi:hypothetical protein